MTGHYEGPKRYEYLKDMSIEELEELLTSDDLHPDDEEEFYDAVVDEIVQRERKNPTGRIPDVDEAWKEFKTVYCSPERKGELLFPDEEGVEEKAPASEPVLVAVQPEEQKKRRRAFPIRGLAAAAAIVLCVTTLLPPALGYESFIAMIGHWNDTVFHFVLPNQEPNDPSDTDEENYDSLQAALTANGVTTQIAPHIPEEFETLDVYVTRFPELKRIDYNAFYASGSQNISIYIIQRDIPVETRSYEKDGTLVEEYDVNNVTHYICENNGKLSAIWYNGVFECSLRADVAIDEIKDMINSIYEGL